MTDPFGLHRDTVNDIVTNETRLPGERPNARIRAARQESWDGKPEPIFQFEQDPTRKNLTATELLPPGADDDPTFFNGCGICKEPIDLFGDENDPTFRVWLHAHQYRRHDHEVQPARIRRSEAKNVKCDFCGRIEPINWSFMGHRIKTRIGPAFAKGYDKLWAACDTCAAIFDTGDLDALMDRIMTMPPFRDEPEEHKPIFRRELMGMWTTAFANGAERIYIGPRREPTKLHPTHVVKYHRALIDRFWNNPDLYDSMTSHGLDKAQSLPAFCLGDEYADKFNYRVGPGATMPRNAFNRFIEHITAGLSAAADSPDGGDLYWVSPLHTQLAIEAAGETDELVITRDQLPSKFGFLVYAEPIGEIARPDGMARINAVSWTLVPNGVWINIYFQADDAAPPSEPTEQTRETLGWFVSPNPGTGLRFGEVIPADHADRGTNVVAVIISTWIMMSQQGVTQYQPVLTDKKYARSYQRTYQRKVPAVRLVDIIRRARREPAVRATGTTGRRLEYRMFRKAHLKMQAYGPGRSMRKQIYIDRYIVGPPDAPFKPAKPTVKVLR